MKSILTISLLLTCGLCFGQNLIPNPSFEIYTSCPTSSSQIYKAIPWQGITTNSSDYFNACGTGGASAPCNGIYCHYARTGNAYAGIYLVNGYGNNYREYLQVQLDSTLQLDSCYLVEFYCSPLTRFRWGVNKIGAYLSMGAVNTLGTGLVLDYTPQIVSQGFLLDTMNWMRVSGYYRASGGEQYITIGNFSIDSNTDTLNIGGSYFAAYYYIEDVKVEKTTGCDTTSTSVGISESKKSLMILYPNPMGDKLKVEINGYEPSELILYDFLGQRVLQQTFTNSATINTAQLANGIYFYDLRSNKGTLKTGKLVKQ